MDSPGPFELPCTPAGCTGSPLSRDTSFLGAQRFLATTNPQTDSMLNLKSYLGDIKDFLCTFIIWEINCWPSLGLDWIQLNPDSSWEVQKARGNLSEPCGSVAGASWQSVFALYAVNTQVYLAFKHLLTNHVKSLWIWIRHICLLLYNWCITPFNKIIRGSIGQLLWYMQKKFYLCLMKGSLQSNSPILSVPGSYKAERRKG